MNLVQIKSGKLSYEEATVDTITIINSEYKGILGIYEETMSEKMNEYKAALSSSEDEQLSPHLRKFICSDKRTDNEIKEWIKGNDPEIQYLRFVLDWCDGNVYFLSFAPRYSGETHKVTEGHHVN